MGSNASCCVNRGADEAGNGNKGALELTESECGFKGSTPRADKIDVEGAAAPKQTTSEAEPKRTTLSAGNAEQEAAPSKCAAESSSVARAGIFVPIEVCCAIAVLLPLLLVSSAGYGQTFVLAIVYCAVAGLCYCLFSAVVATVKDGDASKTAKKSRAQRGGFLIQHPASSN
eukprot:gnl/TRDRNA2_/TRDRNA2_61136_c0_seq1.p1 gnl/TRDRNA2_/TRDRNA2_61136_c0~~gnl/TRDRNA2_/TRDRNA2_61136_c0_seq1.p1  ORF type:complete len:172 (-),score=31.33 gnl/TRDRNA2_/TRDRNA2_61136_c0_seq1:35-550(-)